MDNQYLSALTERGGITIRWATKGHLAIPKGFSISVEETQNIDILTHPRIPDAVKVKQNNNPTANLLRIYCIHHQIMSI